MSPYAWKHLKPRTPCARQCGSKTQRPDGVCWRCAEAKATGWKRRQTPEVKP